MNTALAPFGCAVHADWSVDPRKRWMTVARRDGGMWRLAAPEPVGDVSTLLDRLRGEGGAVLLGVDLPLGLPRGYAARHAREADFPAFLRGLAGRPAFFRIAATLDEVSGDRPFYPLRAVAGMTRAGHATALGLPGADALCRDVDRATAERPAGAPPFWTLGANQSGRAALAAWRDMLLPGLAGPAPPLLWPFDGDLAALAGCGRIVMAETYPAEAMRHLRLRMGGSKRRQADRLALAPALLAVMAHVQAAPDAAMRAAAAAGFGSDAAGEDRFDCTLGALCVLNVLAGHRPAFVPDDKWIRRWEGWVLGQTALPGGRNSDAGMKQGC